MEIIKGYEPKQVSENLQGKVFSAITVIKQFYNINEGRVHVSFSGGMDSTVLLHLVRRIYPDVKGVHLDTMQEYKGIREHVRRIDNIEIIRPEMTFTQVVRKFGYPIVSKKISRMLYDIQHPTEKNKQTRELYDTKFFVGNDGKVRRNSFYLSDKHRYLLNENIPATNKCCVITKERPLIQYRKKHNEGAFIGMLSDESQLRRTSLSKGCINTKNNTANPFKGWTKQDILEYAMTYKLRFASEYGTLSFNGRTKNTNCQDWTEQGVKVVYLDVIKKVHWKEWKY